MQISCVISEVNLNICEGNEKTIVANQKENNY